MIAVHGMLDPGPTLADVAGRGEPASASPRHGPGSTLLGGSGSSIPLGLSPRWSPYSPGRARPSRECGGTVGGPWAGGELRAVLALRRRTARSTPRRLRRRSRWSPPPPTVELLRPPGDRGRRTCFAGFVVVGVSAVSLSSSSRSSPARSALAGGSRARSAVGSPWRCRRPAPGRVNDRMDSFLYGHRDRSTAVRADAAGSSSQRRDRGTLQDGARRGARHSAPRASCSSPDRHSGSLPPASPRARRNR